MIEPGFCKKNYFDFDKKVHGVTETVGSKNWVLIPRGVPKMFEI